MTDLIKIAQAELAALADQGLARTLKPTAPLQGMMVERAGKHLINFSSNDYLGLAQDPALKAASIKAIEDYGVGSGASRLVTGDHPLFRTLEDRIAALKGAEDAVIFGSGYLANIGTIPVLVGAGDLILADKLAHACILDGAALSGAKITRFRHNDMGHLADLLTKHREGAWRCLIITDGVFSMDGDLAPLPDIMALAQKHDAWVMTDDAHALGVVGGGRGSGFAFEPAVSADIQMGTFSKAAGSYGGYVAGSKALCDWLRNKARSLIYSTGLPPASVAASIAAIDIIATDSERVAQPLALARLFAKKLRLPKPQSAIVPLIIGDEDAAMMAANILENKGFLVAAIRPPTVPPGTARLRVTFSAGHNEADIERLAMIILEDHILP